jgi:Holliday junction resolvasome RuvABC endonuclease subunit
VTAPNDKVSAAVARDGAAADTRQPLVTGLDLSLTATGVALPNGVTRTLATRAGDGDRRLSVIANTLYDLLSGSEAWNTAEIVVIEDLPAHARAAGITGMVHGAVRVLLIEAAVPYALVPPASLKKYATGRGNATKADMRMALYQRAGLDLRDDNQVDAWWLRTMGLDALGAPVVPMPKTHRAALDKVAWPEVRP